MKQKLAILFLMALFPLAMMAYDCLWDGIYYNIDDNTMTAEVTSGDTKYSGNVVIPNTISYGNGYLVTSIGDGGCPPKTALTKKIAHKKMFSREKKVLLQPKRQPTNQL